MYRASLSSRACVFLFAFLVILGGLEAGTTGPRSAAAQPDNYTPTPGGSPTATHPPTFTPTPTATICGANGWQVVSSPNVGNTSALYGVAVAGADDAWAVGLYYDSANAQQPLIQHWNGSAWNLVATPPLETSLLQGVTVIAPDDVWAVGTREGFYATLIMHWDGTAWSVVPSPSFGSGYNRLFEVEGAAADDVWAVGQASDQLLLLHWNGTAWSRVTLPGAAGQPTPRTAAAAEPDGSNIYGTGLYDLTVLAPDDVWAVGTVAVGPNITVTYHWDGQTWTRVPSPSISGGSSYLTGVSGAAADAVWAVGYSNAAGYQALILHWDGSAWSIVNNPAEAVLTAGRYLYAVAAAAPDDVWAVGKDYQLYNTTTVILHWDGSTWTRVPSPSPQDPSPLYGVAIAGPGNAWTVGITGYYRTLIERYPAAPCPTASPAPPTETLVPPTATATAVLPTDTAVPPSETATAILPTETTTAVPPTLTPATSPTNTPRPNNSCQYAIGSFTSCLDAQGCAGYQIPLQNTGSTAVTLNGSVVLEGRNGVEIGRVVIPDTEIAAEGTTLISGQVCGIVNPDAGPFQLVVTVQDVARVCDSKVKRQPVQACDLPQVARTFADVPVEHTFYSYSMWMAMYGFIQGYACGGSGEPCDANNDAYFRSSQPTTRAQLLKMIVNASHWPLDTPAVATFADVPVGNTFYAYVETGVRKGLISGYACGRPGEPCDAARRPYFRPDAHITRGQLSKVLALAWGFADSLPSQPTFADVPATDAFFGYVETMARYGFVQGYACGQPSTPCDAQQRPYFLPTHDATRGQVTKFVTMSYRGP
jgi:hypothetical protein